MRQSFVIPSRRCPIYSIHVGNHAEKQFHFSQFPSTRSLARNILETRHPPQKIPREHVSADVVLPSHAFTSGQYWPLLACERRSRPGHLTCPAPPSNPKPSHQSCADSISPSSPHVIAMRTGNFAFLPRPNNLTRPNPIHQQSTSAPPSQETPATRPLQVPNALEPGLSQSLSVLNS